jgi:hypothetical protein
VKTGAHQVHYAIGELLAPAYPSEVEQEVGIKISSFASSGLLHDFSFGSDESFIRREGEL